MEFSRYPQLDLEWLVRDTSGCFAIFTTNGSGFAPSNADSKSDLHAAVMDRIPTPNWGSNAIWSDYARAGLYCYDWQESTDSYILLAAPTAPLSTELVALLNGEPEPWVFQAQFASSQSINEDNWLAT